MVTLNLGDFQLPQTKQGANQIAVIVDARDSTQRGTVLQHPLMNVRRKNQLAAGDDVYKLPAKLMDDLLRGGDVDYVDPMASAPDGTAYGGQWIAAMQPITLPRAETKQDATDLLVLVQYRLAKVFAPVGAMQTQLLWEGAAAVLSIFLVSFSLWYFVRRASDTSTNSKPTTTVPITEAETIAAS